MKLEEVVGIFGVWPNHGMVWMVMDFGLAWKESNEKRSGGVENYGL